MELSCPFKLTCCFAQKNGANIANENKCTKTTTRARKPILWRSEVYELASLDYDERLRVRRLIARLS